MVDMKIKHTLWVLSCVFVVALVLTLGTGSNSVQAQDDGGVVTDTETTTDTTAITDTEAVTEAAVVEEGGEMMDDSMQDMGIVTAGTVAGTLDGVRDGNFDKIYLELDGTNPSDQLSVTVDFDRENALQQGLGFYILTEQQIAIVQRGGDLVDNNVGAGSPITGQGTGVLNSVRNPAGTAPYTLVLYNDSQTDASFTITVDNGTVTDASGRVRDPSAPATAAPATAAPATAAPATAAPATDAPAADAVDALETLTDTATTTSTVATTATATATTTATAATAAAPTNLPPGVTVVGQTVQAESLRGELPVQFDQHYIGLLPNERDARINLSMTFDPQGVSGQLNFFVLDQSGLSRFLRGDRLSDVSLAAGNSVDNGAENELGAAFTASGFGSYTVIIANNTPSAVQYTLTADGGTLLDDSEQTITAQEIFANGLTATSIVTDTAAATDTATTTATTTAAATTAAATTTAAPAATTAAQRTINVTPGSTYTIRSGDSISLIARAAYGDINLYTQLCAFNNIANCNVVEVGDVIQVPTLAQLRAGGTATATTADETVATDEAATTDETDAEEVTDTADVTDTESVTDTGAITITTPITDEDEETDVLTDTEATTDTTP